MASLFLLGMRITSSKLKDVSGLKIYKLELKSKKTPKVSLSNNLVNTGRIKKKNCLTYCRSCD